MRAELYLPVRALELEPGAQKAMSCERVSIVRGMSAARSEMAVGAKSKAGV